MFNVKIIKLKDIIKIVVIAILCYVFFKFVIKNEKIKEICSKPLDFNIEYYSKLFINSGSSIIRNISKEKSNGDVLEETKEYNKTKFMEKILEIGLIELKVDETKDEENEENKNQDIKNDIQETNENVGKNDSESENKNNENVDTNVSTQIVTQNPIAENYNKEYNGIKIKNETSYELTDDIFNTDNLDINTNNILIFHTHTCESYTQTENTKYEESGNFRTTDLNYSVAKVGDELTSNLQNLGFNVLHNKTYHDYPAYTGSYKRSLSTVQEELKNFNSDIIIDLHRDAIGSKSDYAPIVKIGDDYCAQLMFVMGSDGGGLSHQNWRENLKFAIKVQQKANEIYPGLFKSIVLRNSRYNQHLGKAACIIEVGATGNTLEQANCSMKYLAKVLEETL